MGIHLAFIASGDALVGRWSIWKGVGFGCIGKGYREWVRDFAFVDCHRRGNAA